MLSLIVLVGFGCTSDPEPSGLRGVWLTNVDSRVMFSEQRIDEAMRFLGDHHFNAVFPVVWNAGYTLYPSSVMGNLFGTPIDPRLDGRDPLQEVIDAAHRHDIRVIPWFEYGFASSYQKGGGRILAAKPEWAARDRDGNLLSKNGFEWMNAYHPEVQGLLIDLVSEVVERYDVDGVQGDDRLPAQPVEGGYSDVTVALYRDDHGGATPPDDPHDPHWKRWRADLLNAFAERLYAAVKTIDPQCLVSWAPSFYPWSYHEYLQDWPAWLRGGYADMVIPQNYRYSLERYNQTLAGLDSLELGGKRNRIYSGMLMKVGDYVIESDHMIRAIHANRQRGVQGEVFFFYEGLRENGDALADTLLKTVYSEPALFPLLSP